MAKTLITGGAGFIGSNLVRHLLEHGHEVRVLDDFSTGYRSNLAGLDLEVIEGSILDPDLVRTAARGVDAVVHLAARGSVPRSVENPSLTNEINVTGTLNVLLAARDAGAHVSFASSSSVYGANAVLPKTESLVPMPRSPYAVSKLAGESYVNAFQQTYGLAGVAFRFFNAYGPFQSARHAYAAVVPAFLGAFMDGTPVRIHGDGHQTRDFTAVASMVEVLRLTVERRIESVTPVNLAFGSRTSLLELVDRISSLTDGERAPLEFLPARAGDVRASTASNARLRELVPDASALPLDEGLQRTIRWFQDTGARQW